MVVRLLGVLLLSAVASTVAAAQTPIAAPELRPVIFKHDFDAMVERRLVRILVVYSKTFYFLDRVEQRGSTYDLGVELEKMLNANLKDRARPMRVVFVPVRRDQLFPYLVEGRGDIAAANLTITPEREKAIAFTDPFVGNVTEVLVTRRGVPAPATVEELSGHTVYVRRSSSFYSSVEALNRKLQAQRKPPVKIELADENLESEDILEMVNAGLIDATIVDRHIGEFWAQIFDGIEVHPEIALRREGQIAWAARKDNPKLIAELNKFVAKNKRGTMTGNVIMTRYLKNTKWARNSTEDTDMRRFAELTNHFQKYAGQYGVEWLLVVAQGYQESRLDQTTRSPVGAVGVMQLMPSTAKDKNVGIPDIHLTEPNIHAGVKYLRFLMDQYFDDPGIGPTDRLLFAFASYNGGPNRIARLRGVAGKEGLDANKWFNNVELIAAREIGRETVQYVSNIFKYYIAYRLVMQRASERKEAVKEAS